MPVRLPMFPLGVVLFPGTPLPLHIFEPRYRRMLADCLAGDRRFGILPPGDDAEMPRPGTVGCIAEVRVNQPLPNGTSNLVVAGDTRFTLVTELDDPAPYHVALVEPFDDEPGTDPEPADLEQLGEAFEAYYLALRQLSDTDPAPAKLPSAPRELSFHISAALETSVESKQRLLAERSTARRVRALLRLLPGLAIAATAALRVHRHAHSNGTGGAHPDILTG